MNESVLGHDIVPLAGMLVGVIALLCGFAVVVTSIVAHNSRRSKLDDMEATLKMEMIQRGMSAAEIKQVLEARMSGNRGGSCDWRAKRAEFQGRGQRAEAS